VSFGSPGPFSLRRGGCAAASEAEAAYTGAVKSTSTVWLVGMMGAGKSTVGRKLAHQLRRRFVDTDHEIARAAGCSVAEIFASQGEGVFRRLELAAVKPLVGSGAVVALGGGAVAQAELREALDGSVVYLRAAPETLLSRVREAESRPLLAGLSADERLERLRGLLELREAAYGTAAITIDTDLLAPSEVAERVLGALQAAEPARAPGGLR